MYSFNYLGSIYATMVFVIISAPSCRVAHAKIAREFQILFRHWTTSLWNHVRYACADRVSNFASKGPSVQSFVFEAERKR